MRMEAHAGEFMYSKFGAAELFAQYAELRISTRQQQAHDGIFQRCPFI